jgi:hypothetical protein
MHSDRRNHHARMMARFPHSDILGSNARLAAPRGLSQPPTSFIGFWRQGIHRVPFLTWQHSRQHQDNNTHTRCSRSLCSSQPTSPDPTAQTTTSNPTRTSQPTRGRPPNQGPDGTPGHHPPTLPTNSRTWTSGRSLGAQQCARPPRPRRRRSHPPKPRHDDEVMTTTWVTVLAAADTLTTE